jgi:diguanylate cyclase (GGDEF)-like protein
MGSVGESSVALLIGPVLQATGAGLLCALFLMLLGHTRRRRYFVCWVTAWAALTAGLAVLAVGMASAPGLLESDQAAGPAWLPLGFAAYFLLKFVYMASLALGTLSYARGHPTYGVRRGVFLVVAVYAVVAAWFSDAAHHTVVFQAPVMLLGTAIGAWSLFTLPAERRTLGSMITGSQFAALGVIWVLYAVVFWTGVPPTEHQWPVLARFMVDYNWFMNLLVHMLMAHGMVLILMEDMRREVDTAHSELAVAHRRLKLESHRDALTGALNRRAFASRRGLQQAWGSYGSVLVIDVDNLKEVNDKLGHAAGDSLLVHLVTILRRGMRATDTLFRWGGDEFLLVLPRAEALEMKSRFGTLLDEAEPCSVAGTQVQVKASIGAAGFQGGAGIEQAINEADSLMYHTKRQRRN